MEAAFNRRIIAVDDDPLILTIYRKYFTGEESDADGVLRPINKLVELFPSQQLVDEPEVCPEQYQITCCSQGEELLLEVENALQEGVPYTVALIDMRMPPGINGMETAQRLRRMDAAIQIVFVTSYSDFSVDTIADQISGPVLWFKKPFQGGELRQAVRNCCTSWNQADELRRLKNNLSAQVELQTLKLEARIEEMELLQKNVLEREQRMLQLKREVERYQPWYQLRQQLSNLTQSEDAQCTPATVESCFNVLLLTEAETDAAEWTALLNPLGYSVTHHTVVAEGIHWSLRNEVALLLFDSRLGQESCNRMLARLDRHNSSVLPLLLAQSEDLEWGQNMPVLSVIPLTAEAISLQQPMQQIWSYLNRRYSPLEQITTATAEVEEKAEHRVLIVDDEQQNLDLLAELLGKKVRNSEFVAELEMLSQLDRTTQHTELDDDGRFQVNCCLQGKDAIEIALWAEQEGHPFEMALVDMRMPPGIDGLETAYQLRKISPEIEIVILTAYSDYSLEQIQVVLGDNFSFITKPFKMDDVRQRVVEGCAKWRAHQKERKSHAALLNLAEDMELEIEQRKAAEQELIAANKAKDDFFSSMSHELRTPLTTMIGYTEVIAEEEQLSTTIREMAMSGMLAGKTLLQLVNDILDLSKLRSGKFELNYAPFDLGKLLQDVADLMQVYGSEQGITVTLEIAPQLEEDLKTQWIGDETRVSQILYNLLSNAVKFSALDGVVALRLDAAEVQGDSKPGVMHYALSVRDQGIGMSAEVCRRVFQPYEQADETIAGRYGGTGLGLYITRQLTEMMEGTIRVESEEGKGALFTVTLPFVRTETAVEMVNSELSSVRIPALQGKVLLAEDTIQLQKLTSMLIEKSGAQVDIANNGVEAIQLGASGEYQLILMDMQMPHVDGIEATRQLRQLGCQTPVVALTANVMVQHRTQFEQAGCEKFLSKPIKRQELYEVLERYLSPADEVDEAAETVESEASNDSAITLEPEEDLSDLLDEEMMQEFWDYVVEARVELEQAWEQGDWTQLKRTAHALKGMGSSYGRPMISHYASKIQDMALSGDRQQMKIDFHQLVQLCVQ